MSTGTSFWKRVGGTFRAKSNGGSYNSGNGAAGVRAIKAHDPGRVMPEDHESSSVASLLPWVRRQKSLDRIDERYQRVVELLDLMRSHFERQDERAVALAAGVDHIGSTLEQLAGAQRTQSESIAAIVSRVEDAARFSKGFSSMLAEVPASLQAQAEAVRAVARQMEASRAADVELVGSLQQFSLAADSLRSAGTAQAETLQRLHDTRTRQTESLQTFVRQQTRLLLIITIAVAVFGLSVVGALGVVVHRIFNA